MSNRFVRHLFVFCAIFAILSGNLFAQKWAEDMFQTRNFNFGNVSRNAKSEYEFEIYNPYIEDIHIQSVSSSCSCTSVSVDKATLKTYETGKVKAHFNTDRFTGSRSATLSVVIDKPFYANVQLHVKGNIRSDIVFQPGEVNFGTVSSGDTSEKSVDFTYQGRTNWKVTALKSTNPAVSAELTEISRNYGQVRYRLKVKLAPDAVAGYIKDRIILVANEGVNTEIPIMVQGYVRPGLTINPTTLFVGNLEPGEEISKKVIIRANSPFAIEEVNCNNKNYRFDFQQTASEAMQSRNIHVLTVSFKAPESDAEQTVTDVISIVTDAQQNPLKLPCIVKLIAKDDPEIAESELADDTDSQVGPSNESDDLLPEETGILGRLDP